MNGTLAFLLSITTGLIFLSFEIVWVHFFSMATGSNPTVFGILLGFYLLGLGLGAGATRRFLSLDRAGTLRILYYMMLLAAFLCYSIMPATLFMLTKWFYAYKYGYGLVCAATLSFGGIFPLIVRLSIKDETHAGKGVAFIYTANILGSAVGTLVCGYLLLDILPLRNVSALMTVLLLILAGALALSHPDRKRMKMAIAPALLIAVVTLANGALHAHMYEKLMYMPRVRFMPPFERVIENRSGVIALTRDGTVFGNGAYDGCISTSLSPKTNPEIENAYLLFLFHPHPSRILQIGLAAGSWAQVMVNGPGVTSLTSIEINPGYLDLIRNHGEVKTLLDNPRFSVVIDDGRRWLAAHPGETFDAIVLNTTFHWRSHSTCLLSAEFIKLAKEHLKPGGILYLNTTMSRSSVRTVAASFAYAVLYDIYVLASDAPLAVDRVRFKSILMNYTIDGRRVLDPENKKDRDMCRRLAEIPLSETREKLLTWTEGHRSVTDDNMVTEFTFLKKIKRYLDLYIRRFNKGLEGRRLPGPIERPPSVSIPRVNHLVNE